MNEAYVKDYARLERSHWWFAVRQKIIRQFIRKNWRKHAGHTTVLNVGAAGGASSEWLGEFGKVVSLEADPSFTSHLRELKLEVVEGSVETLPFGNNHFDLVCAFDVLEHVAADRVAMEELLRVCKPGGIICVTVPAFKGLWSYHDEINQHYRRYNKTTLRALFENSRSSNAPQLHYFNALLFIPVFFARKLANLSGRQKQSRQSDFTFYKQDSLLQKIMGKIFAAELRLLPFVPFPFGVSLLAIVKKDRGE